MNKAERLCNIIGKNKRRIIGLMSGMSMDGIDLALVSIEGLYPSLTIELEDTFFLPYTHELRNDLKVVTTGDLSNVPYLNFRVAEAFAKAVNDFLYERKISPDTIDAIGSHGQTVFHDVSLNSNSSVNLDSSVNSDSSIHSNTRATLQIGSGSVIAERTGILTVFNFRERDIAAGGVAAPLVPLVDYLLFREEGRVIAYNNLGSISNVTLVTPDKEGVYAFDTGPANMPIDYFSSKVSGDQWGFDKDGAYSSTGKIIPDLLDDLLSCPILKQAPPRALGFSEFGPVAMQKATEGKYLDARPEDFVRTAVECSAQSLADAYLNFVIPKSPDLKKIYFSGGGAKNPVLMDRIRALIPESIEIVSLATTNPSLCDAKEALCFAVLANELLSGRAGNLPAVTGAQYECILGEIAL